MTHVAEAYFHLKPFRANAEQLKIIGDKTAVIAANVGRTRFPDQTIIEISVEEGSLIGRAKVIIPVLYVAYNFIAGYDGFKQGLFSICNDAIYFGETVHKKLFNEILVKPSSVYRAERL